MMIVRSRGIVIQTIEDDWISTSLLAVPLFKQAQRRLALCANDRDCNEPRVVIPIQQMGVCLIYACARGTFFSFARKRARESGSVGGRDVGGRKRSVRGGRREEWDGARRQESVI